MAPSNPESSANQSTAPEDPKTDINAAVEELLNTISVKFAGVSSEIFSKMEDMSRRLDSLEAALLANKEKEGTPSKPS